MTVQYVEIAGQKMAMLPVAEFERLVDLAEDKVDVSAAVAAERRRDAGEEYVPFDLINRIIAGENALKVWREYRGLSREALGAKVGCGASMISKMEGGTRTGALALWQALASALDVTIEDILPSAE